MRVVAIQCEPLRGMKYPETDEDVNNQGSAHKNRPPRNLVHSLALIVPRTAFASIRATLRPGQRHVLVHT